MRRVSGPLLDRIDLRVVMPRMDTDELVGSVQPEDSRTVAARILEAWHLAHERNDGQPNASLRGQHLLHACALDGAARETLSEVASGMELTARSVHRVLRVARTIADLRKLESVRRDEILAATSLRDRSLETELVA